MEEEKEKKEEQKEEKNSGSCPSPNRYIYNLGFNSISLLPTCQHLFFSNCQDCNYQPWPICMMWQYILALSTPVL